MTMYEVRSLVGLIGFPLCLIGMSVAIVRNHRGTSIAIWMAYSFATGLALFTN